MSSYRFKLYHFPNTRSARVKWMLHEVVGDDFEVERVHLMKGEQYQPDYVAMNPNHNVPVLRITSPDGETTTMLESGAMVTFLADAFPDKHLAPPPHPLSRERADYLQMLYFGASWMDMMLWQVHLHEYILPEDKREPRIAERYRRKLGHEVDPQLQSRLGTHPFVCGEAFTAADCIMGHNVRWARAYQMCEGDVFTEYLGRLAERPAYVKAFARRD